MSSRKRQYYKPVEALREILAVLHHKKFVLDCGGHRVTFNEVLGSNVIITNGTKLRVICTECGY